MLIDTHCHIHDDDYPIDANQAIDNAHKNGVMQMICIGTSEENSKLAVEFACKYEDIFASVGVHPHEAINGLGNLEKIIKLAIKSHKIVAIGEIGLDYHYDHTPRDIQIRALKQQIILAQKYDLPIVFHVREAFDDFWKVFDEFTGIRGVLHSFTDSAQNADEAIKRGLFIGVNGYSTFIKDEASKAMFNTLPLDKIILETDAPYLTPTPFRGKVNEPAYVRQIAEFQSSARKVSIDKIEDITTANARTLFKL